MARFCERGTGPAIAADGVHLWVAKRASVGHAAVEGAPVLTGTG
jgi:hypothetical protein